MTEKIINDIYSENRDIKRKALKKLNEVKENINDKIIDYLLSLLDDPDPAIVDAAYDAIMDIDDDSLLKKLVKLLATDNIKVRSYVFEILNQRGQKSIEDLLEKLKSSDPNERKFAVDILGEINATAQEHDIIPLVYDKDPNVRFAAAEALSKIGRSDSVKALYTQLKKEKEIWVKFAIIDALSIIGDSFIAKELVKFPLNGDTYVFDAIIETVSKIGDKDVINPLFEILPLVGRKEKLYIINAIFNLVKKYGDEILYNTNDKENISSILKSLLKEESSYKNCVLILLSYFIKDYDYNEVVPFLKSKNNEEKNAAVIALKKLGSPIIIKPLLEIFPDSEVFIKLNIIDALSEFNSPVIKKQFINFIENEPDTVKLSICKLLTRYYDNEIEKLFNELLKKYNSNPEFTSNLNKIIRDFKNKTTGDLK